MKSLMLELFVQHLIYAMVKWFRERRSRDWPIAQGMVHSAWTSGYSAHLVYSYIADGESYGGEHERHFCSAKLYAELFAPKTAVVVRYRRAGRPCPS